jgi:hypothetical protein
MNMFAMNQKLLCSIQFQQAWFSLYLANGKSELESSGDTAFHVSDKAVLWLRG